MRHRGGGFVTCTIPTIGQNATVTFTITAGFDNVSEPFDNVATVNPGQTIFETQYTNDVADAGTGADADARLSGRRPR